MNGRGAFGAVLLMLSAVVLALAVGPTPTVAAPRAVPVAGTPDIPSTDLEIVPAYTGYRPPGPGEQVAGFMVDVLNKGPDHAQLFITVTGLDLSLGLPVGVDCGNTGFQQVTCFLPRETSWGGSVTFTTPICSMGRTVTISVRSDGIDPFPVDNSYVVNGAAIPADWVASCAPKPAPSTTPPTVPRTTATRGSGPSGSGGTASASAPVASPTDSPQPVATIEPRPSAPTAAPSPSPDAGSDPGSGGGAGWVIGGAAGVTLLTAAGLWWRRRRQPAG